jgi:hypothetical protein
MTNAMMVSNARHPMQALYAFSWYMYTSFFSSFVVENCLNGEKKSILPFPGIGWGRLFTVCDLFDRCRLYRKKILLSSNVFIIEKTTT